MTDPDQQPEDDETVERKAPNTAKLMRILHDPAMMGRLSAMEIDIDLELEDLMTVEAALSLFADHLDTVHPQLQGQTIAELISPKRREEFDHALGLVRGWLESYKEALKREF